MRRFWGVLGLLALASSSYASGAAPLDGGSLDETLAELRLESGAEFKLFHYHFDVASPGEPVRADPDGGKSGRLGHTLPSVDRTASIAWEVKSVGWRKVMVYAKSVRIDFGLKQQIFVSPLVAETDCRYRASWEHEQRHAARFSELFVKSLEPLKLDVEAEAASLGLPTPSSPAVVKEGEALKLRETAAERLAAVVERHAARVLEKMDADRALVDSPEAYARAVPACGGRLAVR